MYMLIKFNEHFLKLDFMYPNIKFHVLKYIKSTLNLMLLMRVYLINISYYFHTEFNYFKSFLLSKVTYMITIGPLGKISLKNPKTA